MNGLFSLFSPHSPPAPLWWRHKRCVSESLVICQRRDSHCFFLLAWRSSLVEGQIVTFLFLSHKKSCDQKGIRRQRISIERMSISQRCQVLCCLPGICELISHVYHSCSFSKKLSTISTRLSHHYLSTLVTNGHGSHWFPGSESYGDAVTSSIGAGVTGWGLQAVRIIPD